MTSALLIKLTLFATIISVAYSVGLNGQCGGQTFGSLPCDAGLACFRRNVLYSSCQYSCPAGLGWDCDVAVPAVVAAWGQCGGQTWAGAVACPAGYGCYTRDLGYSQCRPATDCPPGWTCPGWGVTTTVAPIIPVVLPAYTQCNNVVNAACAVGTGCFRFSATYSECRYYCPAGAGWACETDVVGEFGQCGGYDYVGITRCAAGYACYAHTKWVSECVAGCPGAGWDCYNAIVPK